MGVGIPVLRAYQFVSEPVTHVQDAFLTRSIERQQELELVVWNSRCQLLFTIVENGPASKRSACTILSGNEFSCRLLRSHPVLLATFPASCTPMYMSEPTISYLLLNYQAGLHQRARTAMLSTNQVKRSVPT